MAVGGSVRVVLLTAIAMLAFAANSLLARLALNTPEAAPLLFTGIRMLAGALTLAVLLALRAGPSALFPVAGNWPAAAALFGYALLFSLAYTLLGAGNGALILFASVQFGMLGRAIVMGDRPGPLEWLGLVIALAGLVYLLSPGLVAPDALGSVMMAGAGLCWAAYTLLGRGSTTPLVDTAGNFIRGLPLALALALAGIAGSGLPLLPVLYAVLSGALASGLGYAVWYGVLPRLSRIRAGIVQLTVPAIAAIGGVLLIAEPLTPRLLSASAAILGGVALALVAGGRRRGG